MGSAQQRKLFCSAVAKILRDERQKRGLSMTQVSERAGLSQQMVSYIEREIRIPGLESLLRITEALGIEITDVIRRAARDSVSRP